MIPFLVRRVTYPVHEWLKRQRTVAAFHRMRGRSAWSARELETFQVAGLRQILEHAYRNASYYRRAFDEAGARPEDVRGLDDLRRFPSMTSGHIREHREEMVAYPPGSRRDLVPFSSGGSSSEPIRFYVDRGRIASEWAACWRARSWWGLDWGDPWLWLWGSPLELNAQSRIKSVRDRLLNRQMLSAYELTDATLGRYVDVIRRRRPRYIYAYASAVHVLARYVLERGIDLSREAPAVVFTTADMLYPSMRAAITQAFHCPVSVEYGSRDGGFVAHECPEGRLHVHADRVVLEILKGDEPVSPGEPGEIVLTSLDATGMPFIRYRTGDVAAWDDRPCPCGRVFPVLHSLGGRTEDFLMGEGGRLVHGLIVAHVLDEVRGIDRFHAGQPDPDHVFVEILPRRMRDAMPLERIRSRLQAVLGDGIEIDVRCVDSLPLAPSGKHRAVTSDLTHRYFRAGD